MSLTAAEIERIVARACADSTKENTARVRRMLAGLGSSEIVTQNSTVLQQLCAIGVAYAWRELPGTIPSEALRILSAKAQAHLRQNLRSTLEWITRPAFELEWNSFSLAVEALQLSSPAESFTEEKFLGGPPAKRLLSFFSKFAALAGLWSLAIAQWCDQIAEILTRVERDRHSIARAFFGGAPVGAIHDFQLGLSDRHRGGRSVALIEFEAGKVIYKPRTGTSETAWARLLRSMNEHGFQPRLRTATIVSRKNYHWMEYVEAGECADVKAVRRFYRRLGGLIAAAYLMNAVDCHRENLVAAGEDPVLVDVDALWHVAPSTKTQSAKDLLFRTGFFPNSNPDSLLSRSSALGKAASGRHLATMAGRAQRAAEYGAEIREGFTAGWHNVVGTGSGRASFRRRSRRIRSEGRRWIYLATEKYGAVLRASLQPAIVTSAATRSDLIRRLLTAPGRPTDIFNAETGALEQLDIPYFTRITNEEMPMPAISPPPELLEEISKALEWAR